MEHPVVAHREGQAAVLRCTVCADERRIAEGHFEVIHWFLQAHKPCAEQAS